MNQAMPPLQPSFNGDVRYAGLLIRAGAAIIDIGSLWLAEVGIVYVLWTGGLLPITEKQLGEGLGLLLALMFGVFPAWPYFTILESSKKQGTVGKRLLGLQVTYVEGHRIGFGRANARYWSKALSWLCFGAGFIMISFMPRKQALHDLIARTLVLWR
jgi:uncharacterized RDD family membrane protein YckC